MCIYIHIHIHIHIHIYISTCIYIYTYIYIYTCVYIYIRIYIHTSNSSSHDKTHVMTIISDKARLGNVLWTLHVSNSWAKFGQFEIVQQGTPLWASKGAMANWLIGIPIVDYIIISMVSGLGTTLCPNHHVQFRRRG